MTVIELDERTIRDAVAELVYGTASRGYVRTYAAGRVDYSRTAREAYSYGRHFPLFRFIPRNGRRAPLFVVNGDIWRNGGGPSRTPDHQESARRAIADTGIASIVIPFSALDGAGINIDTVRPLHVRADSWETVTHERATLAEVPQWRRTRTVRAAGPVPKWGYDPNLSLEIPIDPDADGVYRWTEDVHRLGDSLFTAVRDGRRARYLSSFDYNERPPLYFICEVPSRGVPATVEAAIDSLAPRAVHAARLAGKAVERQGDVFFIATGLDRATLAERGASFGRLTQWSRRAAPKPGEITYTAPDKAKAKRVAARELATARRLWRETFRDSLARATVAHVPDPVRREENRRRWAEMNARHAWYRAMCPVPADSELSIACDRCGAVPGEPCRAVPGATAGTFLQCHGGSRYSLETVQRRERDDLRRETGQRRETHSIGPVSQAGQRRRWSKLRADRLARIETARADLRRATLTGTAPRGYGFGGKAWRESETDYRRRLCRQAVTTAREQLDRALQPASDSWGHLHNRHGRDLYRQRYGANALAQWQRAKDTAQRRYRPETVQDTARAVRDRETVRRFLMIYGTSHSATEVARVGSAVYARGTVRHAVDLESGRRDGPDHRQLPLAPDIWYLAVRNTVPRQNRRRRRTVAR